MATGAVGSFLDMNTGAVSYSGHVSEPGSHQVHTRLAPGSQQVHTRHTPGSHQVRTRFTPGSRQ
eukprot:1369999-Lingulodinium_polyedra.AAC.1